MSLDIEQPAIPFVKMKIGDFNLTPEIPKYLQSFTYTRKTNSGANDFEVNVFDETAVEVEKAISKGYKDISFSYGWWRGKRSPEYLGRIVDYNMQFDGMGVSLNIDGMSEVVKSHVGDERKKTYKKDNGDAMRIHEIIEDIAEYEGWEIGKIEKTKPVEDKEEEGGEKIFRQKADQASTKFIKDELIDYAESEKTDESDYRLWFEDSVDGTVVNFTPVSYKEEPSEEYVYNLNTRDTNIISFSPSYNGEIMMTSGANSKIVSNFSDVLSNDLMGVERSEDDDSNKVYAEGKTFRKEGVFTTDFSSMSEEQVKKIMNYTNKHAVNQAYKADLEIFGNPELRTFNTISIIVITRQGKIHHTSGIYMIEKIEDSIDNGDFTSKLSLIRDSSKEGSEDVVGDKSGGQQFSRR